MIVGVDTAGDAQAQQVHAAEAVLAGDGIAVGKDIADFTSAHTGFLIKLDGERLGGEFFFRHIGEHQAGIHKNGMATGGTLVGNSEFVKTLGKVFNLADAGGEVVKLGVLVQTYGKCGHVAAVHAAIGEIALEGDAVFLGTLIPVGVAGGNEAAHVHEAVLLGRHGHAVGIREHLAGDFLDGLVGISFLAGLDEICVLGKTGGVEDDTLAIFIGNTAHLAQVLHRHGLAAGGVVSDGNDDERHLVAVLLESLFEFSNVNIAFEGQFKLSVAGSVDRAVKRGGMTRFDVALGGVEVRVAGHDSALLHEVGEEYVLGSAALMGGDYIFEAGEAVDYVFKLKERTRTRIGLIAHHEGSPLAVAHGACA